MLPYVMVGFINECSRILESQSFFLRFRRFNKLLLLLAILQIRNIKQNIFTLNIKVICLDVRAINQDIYVYKLKVMNRKYNFY